MTAHRSESYVAREEESVAAIRRLSEDVAELVELRGRVGRAIKLLMADQVDVHKVLAELTSSEER